MLFLQSSAIYCNLYSTLLLMHYLINYVIPVILQFTAIYVEHPRCHYTRFVSGCQTTASSCRAVAKLLPLQTSLLLFQVVSCLNAYFSEYEYCLVSTTLWSCCTAPILPFSSLCQVNYFHVGLFVFWGFCFHYLGFLTLIPF